MQLPCPSALVSRNTLSIHCPSGLSSSNAHCPAQHSVRSNAREVRPAQQGERTRRGSYRQRGTRLAPPPQAAQQQDPQLSQAPQSPQGPGLRGQQGGKTRWWEELEGEFDDALAAQFDWANLTEDEVCVCVSVRDLRTAIAHPHVRS